MSMAIGAADTTPQTKFLSLAATTKYMNVKGTVLIMVLLAGVFGAARVYQQMFGHSAGLDSTTPEFDTYWMTLLYAELIVLFVTAIAVWSYLWFTRDTNLANLDPRTEMKRIFNLVSWVMAYVFAVYFVASFFGEQDAAWHQTVVRDTSFTASHIVLFYLGIPLYIILGIGSYIYGMTRLPEMARGHSIAFVIGVTGPFLILANLGLNEWGHAFWLMEEIFAHPLHWGFVVLGWAALALGGLLMQVVARLIYLFRIVYGEEAVKRMPL